MIRKGVVEDSEELTRVAHAAKASWGYPEEWLRAWEAELEISPAYIRENGVFVAEFEGRVVGVVGVGDGPDGPEVGHLWVAPEGQGQGWGRQLLEAAMQFAESRQWPALRIVSDPNVVVFYMKFGAVHVGDVPAPVDGYARTLPVLRLPVGGGGTK